jgi:hypothetical protein
MRLSYIFSTLGKVLPFMAFGLALTNYRMAVEARTARIQTATEEQQRLMDIIRSKDNIIINNQAIQNKIAGLTADASSQLENVKQSNDIMLKVVERLKDPNMTQAEAEREYVNKIMEIQKEQQAIALEKANSIYKQIIDTICSDTSGNEFTSRFNEIIQVYTDFLSTITLEQHVPLINSLGLIIITACLISIAGVLYSNYIFKSFNLENYPRLAKFIQLRIKFQ